MQSPPDRSGCLWFQSSAFFDAVLGFCPLGLISRSTRLLRKWSSASKGSPSMLRGGGSLGPGFLDLSLADFLLRASFA